MSIPGLPRHLLPFAMFFREAEKVHGVDAYLLAAVCQRESGGQTQIVGEDGHGYGLMQIDDRYHREFVASGDWKDPRKNILKGAEILAAAIKEFSGDADAEFLGTCRYNASLKRIQGALEKANADKISRRMAADSVTTGKDYGTAVHARRKSFKAKAALA